MFLKPFVHRAQSATNESSITNFPNAFNVYAYDFNSGVMAMKLKKQRFKMINLHNRFSAKIL